MPIKQYCLIVVIMFLPLDNDWLSFRFSKHNEPLISIFCLIFPPSFLSVSLFVRFKEEANDGDFMPEKKGKKRKRKLESIEGPSSSTTLSLYVINPLNN